MPTLQDLLPWMPENQLEALELAVKFVREEFEPDGIVASGSIVRGNPNPNSDLDLVVLHRHPWRQRVQRRFAGVPAEIFVNSAAWLTHAIDSEARQGRPVMAHMLMTGEVVYAKTVQLGTVIAHAKAVHEKGFQATPAELEYRRYSTAIAVEDALDLLADRANDARLMVASAVAALVQHWYALRGLHLPRPKARIELLTEQDPVTGAALVRLLTEPNEDALALELRLLADELLGSHGFFEWDSGRDESPPPG